MGGSGVVCAPWLTVTRGVEGRTHGNGGGGGQCRQVSSAGLTAGMRQVPQPCGVLAAVG